MHILDFREPVSTWTHFVGLLLALPGTALLWHWARGPHAKKLSLLVYGVSLICCYAASTLYHGLRVSDSRLIELDRIDRIGIFILIAGTYTPLAWNLLQGQWRWGTLAAVWLVAAAASTRLALGYTFPQVISTGLYLALGWGSLIVYREIARVVTGRALRPLVVGGLLYSVGALINLIRWPALWPGTFGSHELFHLFVMAGSLAHYWLILTVVLPFTWQPNAGHRKARSPSRLRESSIDVEFGV